jgi:molybdopterin molybdotransferase
MVLEQVSLMPLEQVAIAGACGRVLAQDVVSDIDISPFDNSAMDGFAVRFEDCKAAGIAAGKPLTLSIVGGIGAGAVYKNRLLSGQALRIMTGAPLPEGADTVVKIEDVTVTGESSECPEGLTVTLTQMPRYQEHVRFRGEEAHKGEVLLRRGGRIGSPAIGLLASAGNAEVLVYKRPRVAIISIGSELVEVTEAPGPGQIRNSNSFMLAAAVTEAGGCPTIMPVVYDTYDALSEALKAAVATHDFVITSGGAAQGDYDFVTPVVQKLGTLLYNKVSMKPGKAQTLGLINATPVFGLPGNPGAAFVGFEILIRPALKKMQGITELNRPVTEAIVAQDIGKKVEARRVYLRAQLERAEDGCYRVMPLPKQSSALLGSLSRSNCLLIVPEGSQPLVAGDKADCLRIDCEEGTVL